MDAWQRQRDLSRTTIGWSAASIAVGGLLMRRDDPWWRSFGQQHLGWGVVDLGIVAVVTALQHRRMRRLDDPWAPAALEHERRKLRAILAGNAVADVGYCVLGAVMWRGRRFAGRPKASGAGAAIVIQGAFLAAHDSFHAVRSSAS